VPCPDEHEARGRHGGRNALERDEDAIDALFAVEPSNVEHQCLALGDAELPSRRRPVARAEPIEVHARRHHRDRRPDAARVQLVADHRRGRQHRIGPRGEAGAQPQRGRLHEAERQGDVVRVLLVARVVGEDKGPPGPAGEAARGRSEEKGVVRVDDVEVQPGDEPPDPPRVRNRQREFRVGRGGNRGVAHDPARDVLSAGQAGSEDPRLMPGGLEALPERLDRDRDAPVKRQVVVGEERDPHRQASRQALLNFSKSSGLMFCNHSRSWSGSSALTGSASFVTSRLFALRTTSSST